LERMVVMEHFELEAVPYSSVADFYWCDQCEDATVVEIRSRSSTVKREPGSVNSSPSSGLLSGPFHLKGNNHTRVDAVTSVEEVVSCRLDSLSGYLVPQVSPKSLNAL
jgi:hypothetical protein